MSLQAYLDNITAKTGKTPDEFVALARTEGLLEPGVKPAQIVAWLKTEHGLGHGHAMALVAHFKQTTGPKQSADDRLTKHFAGKKTSWRPVYEKILSEVESFGDDVDTQVGGSYISLRRAGKKFAIVQVGAERLDLGVKLKSSSATGRLEDAGSWNAMVTHRVRLSSAKEADQQMVTWLKQAYSGAGR